MTELHFYSTVGTKCVSLKELLKIPYVNVRCTFTCRKAMQNCFLLRKFLWCQHYAAHKTHPWLCFSHLIQLQNSSLELLWTWSGGNNKITSTPWSLLQSHENASHSMLKPFYSSAAQGLRSLLFGKIHK